MKIILAISDSRGRTVSYVADDGHAYSPEATIALVQQGQIEGVNVVKRGTVSYIRAKRSYNTRFHLDDVTISVNKILSAGNSGPTLVTNSHFQSYWVSYQKYLEAEALKGTTLIAIDGYSFSSVLHVQKTLTPLKEFVFGSAAAFNIDPYLLSGILVDEIVRLAPFEEITDKLQLSVFKTNVSVGVAQVKLDTAKAVILAGYFNPNPDDPMLHKKAIAKTPRLYLYKYLIDPKNNVYFAAATMRAMLDSWKAKVDIDLTPELIGSLYSLGHTPHPNPIANVRGQQIVNEFVPLAKDILDTV